MQKIVRSTVSVILAGSLYSVLAITAFGQELPPKIRGYKVHNEIIKITPQTLDNKESTKISAVIGDPEAIKAGINGITFAIPLEFTSENQSGKVEIIDFHDLKVNGIPIKAKEYSSGFSFRKKETVVLPEPLKFVVAPERILQAALYEAFDSKESWNVTGRIFIFGQFRKFGFYHKRVVPVDIDLLIPNPNYNPKKP